MAKGPLAAGKQTTVFDEAVTGSGTLTRQVLVDADEVLVAVWVEANSGSLEITASTEDGDGNAVEVLEFEPISGATEELVVRRLYNVTQRVKIEVVYSDAATFRITARGTRATLPASVTVVGSKDALDVSVTDRYDTGAVGSTTNNTTTTLNNSSATKIEFPEEGNVFTLYFIDVGETVWVGPSSSITAGGSTAVPLTAADRWETVVPEGNNNELYAISTYGSVDLYVRGMLLDA